MTVTSVLETIGNTPMVDISVLSPNPGVQIFAKLENCNPFGSVKDRVAKSLITNAYHFEGLRKGQTLIEASSGNTGIALAAIGRLFGNPVKIVTPENVTAERKAMLLAMGADIYETPASEGSNGAIAEAELMQMQHPEWVNLGQYSNHANPVSHFTGTGPEIYEAVPGVTHFVSGLGTSGTLMGVGHYLKHVVKEVQIVAIEPPTGETLEGLRSLEDGYIPEIFINEKGAELLDRKKVVWPADAVYWARRLNAECGIFGGPSTGSSLAGAIKIANEIDSGRIVLLVCDTGSRYLSTGMLTPKSRTKHFQKSSTFNASPVTLKVGHLSFLRTVQIDHS